MIATVNHILHPFDPFFQIICRPSSTKPMEAMAVRKLQPVWTLPGGSKEGVEVSQQRIQWHEERDHRVVFLVDRGDQAGCATLEGRIN